MGYPATITLKFLWAFLSPVFGDKLKEILRKKDSPEVAKERVQALYKSLGGLTARNFDFVSALKLYASLVEESVAEERLMEAKGSLYDRADELMSASSRMVEALEQLTPQLEIHQYELYQQIVYYKETRCWEAGIGEELDYAMFDAEHGKFDDLNRILSQEEQNYRQIDQCLRDFRIFIIKEIPFGQSF